VDESSLKPEAASRTLKLTSRKLTLAIVSAGLMMPKGGPYWQYTYRFAKKYRKFLLGTYPVVILAWARIRHKFARHRLAPEIDPG
jgi:hypothetical protein